MNIKLIVAAIVLSGVCFCAAAQNITNYTFTASTLSFNNISGATTPTQTAGTDDEGYFNGIPIGFDFWYMGTRYTTVSISTNGWIALGAGITNPTPTNNLSSGGAPRPVLAPLWDDLELSAATKVSYVTTGLIGSRIFTIQCLNVKWTTGATGNTIAFQTKLYEGSGKIEFVYNPLSGALNAPTASIGIAATATGSGNFLSVNNAGTSVSSTVGAVVTSKPVSGRTYAFTSPVPTTPSGLSFTSVGSSTMTLNWSDLSSTETGFVISRSLDGFTYTFDTKTAVNATSYSPTGLSPNTLYYWRVQAVSEGALSSAISGSQSTICVGSPTISGTSTETCVGGSTGTITASASGGSPPYTYSLNGGFYQSSPVFTALAAGTYTLNVLGTSGCVSSTSVIVNPYPTSTDDQNATATDSWVGHVYDGINFDNYIGHYTKTESFNELFGGSTFCFNVTSGATTPSIQSETFSVKYRMTSTRRGLFIVDLGSDDGNRLTVDGTLLFNSFTYQSFSSRPSVLMNLNGSSTLLYEYFESLGNNQIVFQNITSVFSNTLSTNLSQTVCVGNAAAAISGNVFGSLPSGITLSGTGYQWTYSTTVGGARTNISGATAATFTPSTLVAPFNVPGTYFIYRNAALSSANNISPNPYVATNESNAATLIVNSPGQWSGSISTDWAVAGNWCTGVVPTATTDVTIASTAVRMPNIVSSVACRNLTINSGATLTTSLAGTLNIAGNLTNNGTIINNGTTNFNGTTGQQTFTGVSSFFNLTLANPGGLLVSQAITINNDLTIASGTLNANNFQLTVKRNWTNNSSATAFLPGTSTTIFNGNVSQQIGGTFTTNFNNLQLSNSNVAATVALANNVNVLGTLAINAGTYDLATFTSNRSSAGGTVTILNNARLKIGGTNTFPSNFTASTLGVSSTVEYSGTNQTVANLLYGDLTLSSSGGAAIKTLPASPMTVSGNLATVIGSGSSVTLTASANLTVSGNVSIGASTTFDAGSFSHTIAGNWVNAGTFTGNTSTVNLAGASTSLSGAGLQNFNNLTVAASGITFSSATVSVGGNLSTTGSGSVNQTTGTLQMTGTTKTITGQSISLMDFSVTGSVSTSSSLTVAGNISVGGTFAASAGIITMTGTPKSISGAGTKSFSTLSIDGSITATSNFSISSSLSVNGGLTASAGTATFTGTSQLDGTADLHDVAINGTSLQLGSNSILGISGSFTILAGTLNITSSIPNTVNFNSTGAQNIPSLTYNNLTLSGGNTKTALGAITINNSITIGTSTTFNPGAFAHSIINDWINNGSFTAGSSTIQFTGTVTSNIIGNTTFNILTINNTTADTEVILGSNISVNTINMTNGTLLTGSNTLTILNTRTGNGNIYGSVQRTHAFTTGVAYEFKNPSNSITFATVTGVTSITVHIDDAEVSDFPFGGAVRIQYDITVPAGTYNATLRLSYDDDELNGNNESTMGLWNYNGASWVSIGKSANNTTSNYVERNGLTNITNRWTLSDNANVVRWNGGSSTNWNTAANWTVVQGSPSTPPSATDIVQLGTVSFTNQPTISTAVTTNNIIFGSAKAVALTIGSGGSLTTQGSISGNWSVNATHTIAAGNQNLTVNGDLVLSDGINGQSINITIGSGTVEIANSIVQQGDASIVFSGSGTLNVHKDFDHTGGTFTSGTGTVNYVGDENQHVAHVNYNNLGVNKTAGIATVDFATSVAGNLAVTAGELDNSATFTITGNVTILSGGILVNQSDLHIGGNWVNNGTYVTLNGNEIFDGSGAQSIAASVFNNLVINKPVGTTAVLTGDVGMSGDLTMTSGTFDIKTFNCNRTSQGGTITIAANATFIVGANNSPLNFSNGTLDIASTVIADGVNPQFIFGETFGNLVFRNAGTKILVAPITVNGDLIIEAGATFDGGSEVLTINGNWINNGTYIPSTGTTIQGGISKTISGNTTFNNVNITGTYVNLSNITYNGLLHITSTGSISSGTGIFTVVNGDLINNGVLNTLGTTTFTGNVVQTLSLINAVTTVALIVNFNGSVSPVLNSTSAPLYGFLNINNTGGVNPSVDWTIQAALTIGAGASFNCGTTTQHILGSLTNNGTITSAGLFDFVPTTPVTLNFGTNFSSTGSVNFGGSGAITLSGTPVVFKDVSISNTNAAGITPSSGWTLTNALTIGATSTFNAGSNTYLIGGDFQNLGSFNAGSSLISMNGSSTQDLRGNLSFNHLTINNSSGVVTLSSSITVGGNLNFAAGQIQTNANIVIISPTGAVTGASVGTGWVNGSLQKNVSTGSPTRTFEVGDDGDYTPVVLNLSGVTVAGNFTLRSTGIDHPSIAGSTINSTKDVNRYWTITNSGTAFSSYDATFNFVALDVDAGATTSSFGIQLYNGAAWASLTTTSPNSTNIKALGVTSVGDFIIGEICNAGTTISYPSSPYCSTGGTAAVSLTGISGGTFSSTAGLSINGTTGDITLGTSAAGTYNVSYVLAPGVGCSLQTINTSVTVTTAPAATISYSGSPYTITSGGIATVTFSGTQGGAYSSTPGLSINSTTGTVTLDASLAATYTVSYTMLALLGCPQFVTNATITLNNNLKTWDGGALTSNWGDATNWNPDGVPGTLDNVDLSGSSAININVAALVNNLTLNNSGLVLTINPGSSLAIAGDLTLTSGTLNEGGSNSLNLTIAGDWINNGGTFIGNTNIVGFNGSSTQNILGTTPTNFTNISITNISNPGVSIESNQNLHGILTLGSNVFFDADGSSNTSIFTLVSGSDNPTTDASVAPLPAGSFITGNVTVQRFMTKEGSNNSTIYRYISSPVQDAAVSDLQNEIPITGSFTGASLCSFCVTTPSMFRYDETTVTDIDGNSVANLNDGYVGFPTSSNSETLVPGVGYALLVRNRLLANTSWNVRGHVNTGNVNPASFTVTHTNSSVPADDGWNLIGNPFPSTIDWNAASGWTKTSVDGTVYTTDNGNGATQYATWNGTTGTNGGSRYIAAGQGFWIKTNAGGAALQATEAIKAAGTQTTFFKEGAASYLLRITMTQGASRDEAVIHFRPDATSAFDNEFDAWKLKNSDFNLSSLSTDNKQLAINSWSPLACDLSIKLNVDNSVAGNYSMNFMNMDSFDEGVDIQLKDQFLDRVVSLANGSQYPFSITADKNSYGSERFLLLINGSHNKVDIHQSAGNLSISYNSGIQWYYNGAAIAGATSSMITPVESGVYSVVVNTNGCKQQGSVDFSVTGIEDAWAAGLNVYPNPTTGEIFIISKGGGIRSISIANMLGQIIDERRPGAGNLEQTEKIQIHGHAAGFYLLKIETDRNTYTRMILKK